MPKTKYRKKRISKNTNYKIGRNFEYRVKRYYEKLGYFVVRSYASKGAADLYCMKPIQCECGCSHHSDILLIQCKNYKGKLPEVEVKALQAMEKLTGGRPIHVFKDKQRKLQFVLVS